METKLNEERNIDIKAYKTLKRSRKESARAGDASKAKCSFGSAVWRRRLPAAAEGGFIAASLIPVPSQPEGSLVHPRELLDPTAQGHGFVQCSVSLPGPVTTQCIPMTNNLWGRAVQSSVIGIGNSFKCALW